MTVSRHVYKEVVPTGRSLEITMDNSYYSSQTTALSAIIRNPPHAPQTLTYPQRPNVGNVNDNWVFAQFEGNDDAEHLRTKLRSILDQQWWLLNLAPPGNDLDEFVRRKRCLFCGKRRLLAKRAMRCVHRHLNYHPP